ncbi:MAG: D-alanyl-D-alanine carboxypeptidase [Ruminococcaceae bacterium]|nr:D-alanyl-D-alanine carboxypeptidase [Oscillospiraceae bacterium]
MKKIRFFCLILSFLLLFTGYSPAVKATSNDLAVTQGCHSVDAAMTLSTEEKLTETAKAVVVYELKSGTMLYHYNPDGRIQPTSMVKMMTALVALEMADLDEEVVVKRKVLDQVAIGSVSAGLKANETISMRDLLYCTMVASANDAAVVIANHIAGSAEAFVDLMNEKAAQLGCKDTHYSNVHGLHDELSYTSARDICRITEAALENELFRTMFCTVDYTVPATNKSEPRKITTTNHMMNPRNLKYYDARVTGGKTGATDKGGRCLTMTAQYGEMELLCIVMGATPTVGDDGNLTAFGSFEESTVLMNYVFENFELRQVFFSGQSLAQYPVENGANDVVTQAVSNISTVLPIEVEQSQLRWVYQNANELISAPVSQGQKLGDVEVWYGNKCLARTDMVAMNAVALKQEFSVPQKPASRKYEGSWTAVLLILLGGVVAVFVGMVVLRAVRIMQHNRRKNRRGRRRS